MDWGRYKKPGGLVVLLLAATQLWLAWRGQGPETASLGAFSRANWFAILVLLGTLALTVAIWRHHVTRLLGIPDDGWLGDQLTRWMQADLYAAVRIVNRLPMISFEIWGQRLRINESDIRRDFTVIARKMRGDDFVLLYTTWSLPDVGQSRIAQLIAAHGDAARALLDQAGARARAAVAQTGVAFDDNVVPPFRRIRLQLNMYLDDLSRRRYREYVQSLRNGQATLANTLGFELSRIDMVLSGATATTTGRTVNPSDVTPASEPDTAEDQAAISAGGASADST